MIDAITYLLNKGSEEAGEVAQACSKASLFGLFDADPKKDIKNIEHLVFEVNDLLGVLEMVKHEAISIHGEDVVNEAFSKLFSRAAINAKKCKVLSWAARSVSNGILLPTEYDKMKYVRSQAFEERTLP